MNIRESCDLNTLLDWLFRSNRDVRIKVAAEEGMEAAARLADKANKALSAGHSGDDVRRMWKLHWRQTKGA